MFVVGIPADYKSRPFVRITKQSAVDDPVTPTPKTEDYIPGGGEANVGMSLPVDYSMTGWLLEDIEVGKRACMFRKTRNDVEFPGVFSSSVVAEILPKDGGLEFHTENSIYHLEWL